LAGPPRRQLLSDDELEAIRAEVASFDTIEAIDDDMDLAAKLPPRPR
jgi:hypothetical protein